MRLTTAARGCITVLEQRAEGVNKTLAKKNDMDLHISPGTGVPIYLQIVNQVKYLVATGQLLPEQELPPIRELAAKLIVNPNTVVRAYRELEMAGTVIKRGTVGTFVSGAGSPLARDALIKILTERIDALLAEARHMRIGLEEVIQLIRERDKTMQSAPREK